MRVAQGDGMMQPVLTRQRLDQVRQRRVARLVVGAAQRVLHLEHSRCEQRIEAFKVVGKLIPHGAHDGAHRSFIIREGRQRLVEAPQPVDGFPWGDVVVSVSYLPWL